MVTESPAKLLFAISSLHGGGAERVISNLANYYDAAGFQVSIVCLNASKPAYLLSEGIKVISLVHTKRRTGLFFRAWYAGLSFFRLRRILKQERPEFAISFMTSANIWTGLTCLSLNIPYLVSERITPDYTLNRFNPLLKRLSFAVYKRAKAVVLPSKGMIEGFRKTSPFKKLCNFEVINNPINEFPIPTKEPVYPGRFILAAGRLSPQKGFDLLIAAFRRVEEKNVHLLIYGEGEQRAVLEEQISALGLSQRVKLIGFRENMQDYYRQAELFVLSSRNEGYPNALLEAMSMGTACIATDCEYGPSDILESGKNGLLIKTGNIYQMATAIKMVLDDPVLKAKIALNAKRINETNSLANTSAKWLELIRRSTKI
jgi:glycosyltransferase involved in cell wall biosynthesis